MVMGVLKIKTIMEDKMKKISQELNINLNTVQIRHSKLEVNSMTKTVIQEI